MPPPVDGDVDAGLGEKRAGRAAVLEAEQVRGEHRDGVAVLVQHLQQALVELAFLVEVDGRQRQVVRGEDGLVADDGAHQVALRVREEQLIRIVQADELDLAALGERAQVRERVGKTRRENLDHVALHLEVDVPRRVPQEDVEDRRERLRDDHVFDLRLAQVEVRVVRDAVGVALHTARHVLNVEVVDSDVRRQRITES